ncbi:MAG: type III secretion system export apparatus subunit SctV [Casimicrobium sp.]
MAFGLLALMILGLFVLPIPPMVVDVLLAFNIAAALGLLVYALHIDKPTAFSTFPALLLFTTLFRIALNVATARQILLNGYAGQIIEAFGMQVVGGNLVVGLVVFAIIAIVQFIVVAKGAERVAEVSARFTLDALPGRQVSIDSDLRSGVITQQEARTMRAALASESHLFGAMDGAMKFVKGDVIAGIVIVLINLVGGIAIGVLMKNMEVGDAVHRYSVMSIGDGLVSQLPALVVAFAAGVIVTRVEKGESSSMASQIGAQIVGQPKALMLTGGMTVLFAFVPGFPWFVFIPLGILMVIWGRRVARTAQAKAQGIELVRTAALGRAGAKRDVAMFERGNPASALPVTLLLSEKLAWQLDRGALDRALAKSREALTEELGVPFPGLSIRISSSLHDDDQLRVLANDVPFADRRLPLDKTLAVAPRELLIASGIEDTGEFATSFLVSRESFWLDNARAQSLRSRSITLMAAEEALASLSMEALRLSAHEWFGVQETQGLVAACEEHAPDLSRETLAVVPLTKLSEVLRALLSEGLPLRDLRSIFQALLRTAQRPHDENALINAARQSIRKYIAFRYADANRVVHGITLEPSLEERIRTSIKHTESGPLLTLPPDESRRIQQRVVEAAVGWRKRVAAPIVVLTEPAIRQQLRKLVEMQAAWLPVLSHDEVAQGATVKTLTTVSGAA